jgi:hypothetical protein
MRIVLAIPFRLLAVAPGFARPDPPGISPAATAEREAARWAEWEAQARITDGDYDGAIQAQQQAQADRWEVARQEMLANPPRR